MIVRVKRKTVEEEMCVIRRYRRQYISRSEFRIIELKRSTSYIVNNRVNIVYS